MPDKNFEIQKNVVDYAAKINEGKIKNQINTTEAVSLGLMSIFDDNKANKKENGYEDGKVSLEEFCKITPEQYDKYVNQMKTELGKENGRENVGKMNIPSYEEYCDLVQKGDITLSSMKNYIKEKNPEFKEDAYFNPFDTKTNSEQAIKDHAEGIDAIITKYDYKDGKKPEDIARRCEVGSDINFNKACVEADKVFATFDKNKDDELDSGERYNYLNSTPEGQKAEQAFLNSDIENNCQLSSTQEKTFLKDINKLPLKEQQAYKARLDESEISKESFRTKSKGQIIADIYINNVEEEKQPKPKETDGK